MLVSAEVPVIEAILAILGVLAVLVIVAIPEPSAGDSR